MTIAGRVARLSDNQVARLRRALPGAVSRRPGPGRQLVAYIVAEGGDRPTVRDLRAFARVYLPDPMIPSQVVFLDRLPISSTGKIDRRALPLPAATVEAVAESAANPCGDLEVRLAAIWTDVLATTRVGRDENFFELGGHSLLAAQVVARTREAFAIDLPLQEIFEYPTIAALAERIRERLTIAEPAGEIGREDFVL